MKDVIFSLFPQNDFALLAVVMGLPLLGAFVNGVFGRRLGKDAVRLMTLSVTGAAFAAAVVAFIALNGAIDASQVVEKVQEHGGAAHEAVRHGHAKLVWTAWEWMRTSHMVIVDKGLPPVEVAVPIEMKFSIDALSGVMMLVITGVGFLIHVYASSYMADDKAYWRFFTYLNLFVFSMLVLVMGDNLPVLFIGWEGVGLCSYLLIGFWYDVAPNATAGKKAFIANRIGDFGLLCGMFLLVHYTGALDWSGIEAGVQSLVTTAEPNQVHLWPIGGGTFQDIAVGSFHIPLSWLQPRTAITMTGATAVSIAIFLGCTGKSAQLPLYVWLPDAMAGPTPVSALIHAATMVTAGVYLICRLSFVFVLSPAVMTIIAFTGALTALYAAAIALTQNDIKKVLAYSTVSQLGFMFLGVGVGAFTAGFFHVFTHAFFKACLFLGAGSVIHSMHSRIHDDVRSQDMRNMGGLRKMMPLTFGTFVASTLAIIGFPLTSGFFSKDEILSLTLVNRSVSPYAEGLAKRGVDVWTAPGWVPWVLWGMGIVAATLTAFYMCRVVFMTFFGEFRGWTIGRASHAHAGHDDGHSEHDGHHHEEDLALPGPAPHESPRAITIPLLILGTAAIVAGLFNPAALKLFVHGFDFMPMDHWLEPVFALANHGVATVDEHSAHTREIISAVGALLAFAVGSYAAYFMYMQQKGKNEATYLNTVVRVAAAFSGVILVVFGAVILALDPKNAFTLRMVVPWALVVGGIALAYHCVKERKVGLDYVYENSAYVLVDALADTSVSLDQGVIDFVIARLSALIVAATGTLLRIAQNGVVHVYAAFMVVGMAVLGWFFVQPHANATVTETPNGDYTITAAPGIGYGYRWYPDARGEAQVKTFTGTDSLKVHLDEGSSKTVKVEVRNAFSNALEMPVVRWVFPPTATKEVTVTRAKKLEIVGER
ncbi:MAG: NADH-ubiquinone oxidoreductase chain [Labilithrix sp.]|nr:NADH-ubiquinone oxidoreductase chain [Labilithrix sp.]